MSIHHLPGLDHDRWYIIGVNHGADQGYRWRHRGLSLHGPNTEARIEWSLLRRPGFGLGFELGRNGGESDIGLNIYLGPIGSIWLRLGTRWTRWARVSRDRHPDDWYVARHTGVRLFPRRGVILEAKVEDREGHWRRGQPWWRSMTLHVHHIVGRTTCTTTVVDAGATQVPLPEGTYPATYKVEQREWRHVRWPGKARDWFGVKRRRSVSLDIPGGIPVEGKGENSWDCGMDGVFGVSCPARTVEEAVGQAVFSVLRDRERYGGPHDLPHPMTVQEAAARHG